MRGGGVPSRPAAPGALYGDSVKIKAQEAQQKTGTAARFVSIGWRRRQHSTIR